MINGFTIPLLVHVPYAASLRFSFPQLPSRRIGRLAIHPHYTIFHCWVFVTIGDLPHEQHKR